ncbi:hypothetical protein ACIRD6_35795 [Streptomyces sp. NPDC102473]|uniref:hypothetical protein n=1 Tax=Streptomyces sp. NPDC102473 TaxID=3366180 RepID=UPI0037F8A1C9
MQLHELEAWLGDDHGLTSEQLDELLTEADEIEERYPDADDQAERDAALSAAYRLRVEPVEEVLADFNRQRADARAAEAAASAGLQQAAQSVIHTGHFSEAGFARVAGVDRMTVRKWTQDQKDRALFIDAIYTLIRRDTSKADQAALFEALSIRDTSGQAGVFLAGLSTRTFDDLRDGEQDLLDRAEKRARQIV